MTSVRDAISGNVCSDAAAKNNSKKLALNVLISGAGRRVALLRLFRQSLAMLGVRGELFATDVQPFACALDEADRGFLVPAAGSAAFIPHMLELCQRWQVGLIVPTLDHELAAYAHSRSAFAAIGTHVLLSCPETVTLCADKLAFSQWLERNAFPAPRTVPVMRGLDAPPHHRWDPPLVLKPRFGSGSQGLRRIHSVQELASGLAGDWQGDHWLLQEPAAGREYTVDVWMKRPGEVGVAVPRERLEVRHGEVSKARTVRHQGLIHLATRVCEALPGAAGVLNVQIFAMAAVGPYAVLEVNPRYGGGFPLTWQAGAQFPLWQVQQHLGQSCTARADAWASGLTMLRYDDATFRHEDMRYGSHLDTFGAAPAISAARQSPGRSPTSSPPVYPSI